MAQERYSEEAAREILKRAVAQESTEREFSRQQLLEMAAELGISEEGLVRAERQWAAERTSLEEEAAFQRDRREFEAHRRREFYQHLVIYGIINTFLFLLNAVTSFGSWWFIFPLLGWGIGIAIHAVTVLGQGGDEYEKEFIEWRTKRQIRQDTLKRLSS